MTDTAQSTVTIALDSSDAGYNNTVGYYIVGDGGVILGVRILYENAHTAIGDEYTVTVPGDDPNVGLFIIADGYDTNQSYRKLDLDGGTLNFIYNYHRPDARPATIYDSEKFISLVYVSAEGKATVLKGDIFHTLLSGEVNNLNEDGKDHAVTGTTEDGLTTVTTVGFEDLINLGDKDYNDVKLVVTITRPEPPNAAPIAADDSVSGNEDTVITGNVLADNGSGADSDADGDALAVIPALITTANGGTVELLADGNFTYTPAENFFGADSFEYMITDGNGNTAEATVTLTVASVNDTPVAVNDSFAGNEDTVISGNVLTDNGSGVDSDIENNGLGVVAAVINSAMGGTVVLLANGDFMYQPPANFAGNDSFEYTLIDADGGTAIGTVSLTVANVDIVGTEGDDVLTGTGGPDEISALGGDDLIIGTEGVDFIDGGTGNDSITYEGMSRGVNIYLYGAASDGVNAVTVNVENATGSNFADYLAGDEKDNILRGLNGNDTLTGNLGNDTLYGGAGLDTLKGGYGDDSLFGEADDDRLYGLDGDDNLDGGDGADKLYGDLVDGSETFTGNDILRGGAGDDWLYGNGGSDILEGGADHDRLYGGEGDDTARGGSGDDFIYGDGGNDIMEGGSGNDWIDGGAGTDTVSYASALSAVNVNLNLRLGADGEGGSDTLRNVENLRGSAHADTLTGDDLINVIEGLDGDDKINALGGDDTVYGGAGIDTIQGGEGLDTLYGDDGNDLLYGMNGNDTVHGGAGDDKLYGDLVTGAESYTGNDTLFGGDGADLIYGNGGNDAISGGNGSDTLYGGTGADTFVFDSTDGTIDTIKDFALNGADRDIIDISDVLSGFDPGDNIADFVQLRYWGANRTDVKVNFDGQGTDFVTVAVVNGSDFAGTTVQDLFNNGQLVAI